MQDLVRRSPKRSDLGWTDRSAKAISTGWSRFFALVIAGRRSRSVPSLDLLGRRGYRVLEWSNVLARLIDSRALAPAPRTMLQICRAGPEHAAGWVAIMNRCFLEQEEVTPEARDLLEPSFHVPSSAWFLGIVKGVIAGCAGVFLHGDVAVLAGAATLPAYRGRGIQAALSRARIEHAVSSGCNLAVSITRPGTASQHNAERLGFEIVYTRAKMAPGA